MDRTASPDDSDDDTISITSTVLSVHSVNDSFPVVQILAERQKNHKTEYLVEWEGYPLERASWEPHGNIEGSTLAEWAQTKRQQNAGTKQKFDLDAWEARHEDLKLQKEDRHRRRKKKRRKLQNRSKRPVKPKVEDSESSEEAMEENFVDDDEGIPPKATRAKRTSKRPQKKGTAQPVSRASRHESSDEVQTLSSRRKKTIQTEPEDSADDDLQHSSSQQRKRSLRVNGSAKLGPTILSSPEGPLAKTHQKTAIENSDLQLASTADENPVARRRRANNPIQPHSELPSSETSIVSSIEQQPASYHAPQPPTMLTKETNTIDAGEPPSVITPKNVFQAQGAPSRKRHGTLLENSIKAKKPKAYANMRLMYKAEVQGRAVAEQEPNLEVVGGLYDPANPSSMQPINPGTLRRSSTNTSLQEDSIVEQDKDINMKELFGSDHGTPLPSSSPPKFHGRPVCFFWDQNQRKPDSTQPCQNGYTCKFLHEYRTGAPIADDPALKVYPTLEESAPLSRPVLSSLTTTQPSQYFGTPTCFFWDRYEQGGQSRYLPCSKGDSCTYLHEYRIGVPVASEPPGKQSSASSNGTSNIQSREKPHFVDESMTESPQSLIPPWRTKDPILEETPARSPIGNSPQKKESSGPSVGSVSDLEKESNQGLQPRPTLQPRTSSQSTSSIRPEWDPNNPLRAICYFWSETSHCTKGDSCKYYHSNRKDLPICPSPAEQSKIRKNKNIICPWWRRGECHFSAQECQYVHSEAKNSGSYSETPIGPSKSSSSEGTRGLSKSSLPEPPPEFSNSSLVEPQNSKMNSRHLESNKTLRIISTISKETFFGSEEASSVVLNFNKMTPSKNLPLEAALGSLTKIVFNKLCLSQDFEHQRRAMLSAELEHGCLSVANEKDAKTLSRIADELSSYSSGLLSGFGSYSILLYPAKREEWKFLEGSLENSSDIRLRYFIFSPSIPQLSTVQSSRVQAGANYRKFLVNWIHGLDFEQLFPLDPRLKVRQPYKFYLLFPERANKTADFLASWIRSCDPKSIIYSSSTEGSWDSFIKCRNFGSILVHDSVVADLQRLPSLSLSFLQNGLQEKLGKDKASMNCIFWRISERNSPYSIFPTPAQSLDPTSITGQLSATRLFPHGCAFLLTPSLLVAEPEWTLKLLDWFLFDVSKSKFENSASPWKVVVCCDIISYTQNIANAKAKEKAEWETSNRDDPALESHLEERGLSYKTLDIRYKLNSKLVEALGKLNQKLLDVEYLGFGPDFNPSLADDLENPVVYAPSTIGSDDEQALVTWFAGWAMLQLDTFRKFIVVGTREKTDRTHLRKLNEVKKKKAFTIPKKQDTIKASQAPKSGLEIALGIAAKYSDQKPLAIKTSIAEAADDANNFLDRLGEELSPTESVAMELDLGNNKTPSSGIIAKQNGEGSVPLSIRRDSTTRKELGIKSGYEPKQDKEPNRQIDHQSNSMSNSHSASTSAIQSPTTGSPISVIDGNDAKRQNHTLQETEERAWRMFHFESTVSWYKQLQEKGEGWEHILVSDLDTAALALGAPKP